MIEKLKVAELLEEQEIVEKQKAAAQTLGTQQQVEKAKACVKILEELDEKRKEKLSKSILQAEDGNIPLQQQKEYKYCGLSSKLTSQRSAYHSILVDNRHSNDLSNEYIS